MTHTKRVYILKKEDKVILNIVTLQMNAKYKVEEFILDKTYKEQEYESCDDEYYENNGFTRVRVN